MALIKHLSPPLNTLGLRKRHKMRHRPIIALRRRIWFFHPARTDTISDPKKARMYPVDSFAKPRLSGLLLLSLLHGFKCGDTVRVSWWFSSGCLDMTSWRAVARAYGGSLDIPWEFPWPPFSVYSLFFWQTLIPFVSLLKQIGRRPSPSSINWDRPETWPMVPQAHDTKVERHFAVAWASFVEQILHSTESVRTHPDSIDVEVWPKRTSSSRFQNPIH